MAESDETAFLELFFFQMLNRCSDNTTIRYRNQRRRKMMLIFAIKLVSSLKIAYPERRLLTKIRSSQWWETIVLQSWDDNDFKENFRISRNTFNYICRKLTPCLQKKNTVRKAITVERRLALTLVKLGSAGELRIVANLFGVARYTACQIVQDTTRAICKNWEIIFPTGCRLIVIANEFHSKGGLPGCCGALDGSHIPIKAPPHNARDYFSRKQIYSIILQAVCDANGHFLNVNVGWPGSVHDARVLRNSKLYVAGERSKLFSPATLQISESIANTYLVGDQAYPLLPWLMKPYGGTLTNEMANFNARLSSSRISIEHAFGQLKGRWRCLFKENDSSIENVQKQTLACCILHNLCQKYNDEFSESWRLAEDPSEPEICENSDTDDNMGSAINARTGKAMRLYLTRN